MISNIFQRLPENERRKGIWPVEWAMMVYALFTFVLMAFLGSELVCPMQMVLLRVECLFLLALVWGLYRVWPCRLTTFLRIALVMMTLSRWYPDTWEFNRLFTNLDHVFARWEENLFGGQPSLLFSWYLPQRWVSEALYLGYFSYFPMIFVLVFWFWLKRPEVLQRVAFILMAAFFLYYIVYIFLPVAGPQFYFEAPGVDAPQGIFPAVGNYFHDMRPMYPSPDTGGIFHHLVTMAHEAGERPTAAFPSSHIGIATLLLILSLRYRLWGLALCLMPFYLLLCASTVYIHAHYLVDALAGFLSSFLVYWFLCILYRTTFKTT